MPAASGCDNKPIYPYETFSAAIYLPYFWSIGLFIILVFWQIKYKIIKKILHTGYFIVSMAWMVVWGYTLHIEISQSSNIKLDILFPFFIWWLVVIFQIKKIKNILKNYEDYFSRSIWSMSMMAVSFFILFFIEPHYYGLDISFIASLGIVFTGLLYEYSGKLIKGISEN
jgi:hypothetical protein